MADEAVEIVGSGRYWGQISKFKTCSFVLISACHLASYKSLDVVACS